MACRRVPWVFVAHAPERRRGRRPVLVGHRVGPGRSSDGNAGLMPASGPALPLTMATARDRIRERCFRPGAPERVGLEAEWHVFDRNDPLRIVPLDLLLEITAGARHPAGWLHDHVRARRAARAELAAVRRCRRRLRRAGHRPRRCRPIAGAARRGPRGQRGRSRPPSPPPAPSSPVRRHGGVLRPRRHRRSPHDVEDGGAPDQHRSR